MKAVANYKGNWKFELSVRGHTVPVDLPNKHGGEDTGPTPGELFVASLALCKGLYACNYCLKRGLDPTGLSIGMDWKYASVEGMPEATRISEITLAVSLPRVTLDEQTRAGLLEAMEHCTVENSIKHAPRLNVELTGA